jgi:hypothetical protein
MRNVDSRNHSLRFDCCVFLFYSFSAVTFATQSSDLRTKVGHLSGSELCGYCCKSPKLPGDNFPAVRRSDRRPPICVVSITLPRSPVSLSSGDEVPHIFTRKSRLQPGEFLITSAKRLLQQYLPTTVVCGATRSPRRRGREVRAAFAINYDGNPGQDGRPAGPALQV